MLLFIVCFERCSLLECSSRSLNIQLTYVNYLKYICESEFNLRENPDWLSQRKKVRSSSSVELHKGWPSSVWPTSQSTTHSHRRWSACTWSWWAVYLLVTNVTGKCGDQARKERSLIPLCVTLAFAKAGLIARGILTAADWWKFHPHGIWFSSKVPSHNAF